MVRAKLGEGATSEVFLAYDEFHQRDVAIKRVRSGLALDTPEGHFQQHFFAAEAALVGRLQHPNVVQIYDAVDDAEATYLVMEYVEGVTLRRFCRADALLSLEQVVEIGFKCAMALGYVYRQGLIHRDVKPANILARLQASRPRPPRCGGRLPRGAPSLGAARRLLAGSSPTSRSPTSAAS